MSGQKVVITLSVGRATAKSLNYCINQEDHLRVFLSEGNVPMDNNCAEQAIRPFTLGRKNWATMYSPKGTSASAIIYNLVETAKTNELRLYDYFEHLIAEMSKHLREEARQKKLLVDKYVPDRKYIQDFSMVQEHPKAVPSPVEKILLMLSMCKSMKSPVKWRFSFMWYS